MMGERRVIKMFKERAEANRSQSCFEQIYKEHFVAVAKYAFRKVKSYEIAEDVAQETFLEAYRNMDRVKECDCVIAWLITVAKHNIIRRRQQQKAQVAEVPLTEVIHIFGASDMHREEEFKENLLTVLQEDEAELIVLIYKGRYTIAEAAKYFGISVSACKMRIFRAREKLRKAYITERVGYP